MCSFTSGSKLILHLWLLWFQVCGSTEVIVRVYEGWCVQLGYALCITQFYVI